MKNTENFYLLLDPPADGAWNMAVDEYLLTKANTADTMPILRLYAWDPPCLSLGQGQKFQDVDPLLAARAGWQIVRRPTGGKAILHIDELTYSITAHEDHWLMAGGILASYQRIAQALLAFLRILEISGISLEPSKAKPETSIQPVCFEVPSSYEITAGGKKIIGSAQARKNGAVLQHGSIPIAGDISRIVNALSYPDPTARLLAVQKVKDRATTLSENSQFPLNWGKCAEAMQRAFIETFNINLIPYHLLENDRKAIAQLKQNKYSTDEWTARL